MNQKQENKWYLSTWFIAILCACWFLILPAIGGIVLMIMKTMNEKKQKEANQQIIQQNAFNILLNLIQYTTEWHSLYDRIRFRIRLYSGPHYL